MSMPRTLESANALPAIVIGYVSVRSQGGTSFLEAEDLSDPEPFYGTDADHAEAAQAIERAGLEVVAESRLGKAVAGPPGAFEELTGGTLTAVERLVHTRVGREEYVTHLDIVGNGQPAALGVGTAGPAAVGGGVLERPRAPKAIVPAPTPPSVARSPLRFPDDVGGGAADRRGGRGAARRPHQ